MAGFSAFPMISLCVTIPMRRRDRRIWINDETRTITICTLRFLSPFRHPKGAYLASDVRVRSPLLAKVSRGRSILLAR